MEIPDLPTFTVQQIMADASLRGTVSRWEWVGEHHIVHLFLGHGRFVRGRWYDVSKAKREARFVPDSSRECPAFSPGTQLPFTDGYWGQCAFLALNPDLEWQEAQFTPRDGFVHRPNGKTEFIPGGWDHDHCSICWAKISETQNKTYMRLDDKHCLCGDCYESYVKKRSIGFIPDRPDRR
jgi:hypothetical protein